jgi:tetratricopeptide (TPR) repeat protein
MSDAWEREWAKLPEKVRWHIERSDGYIDLKMPQRAEAELDQVPPANRDNAGYRRTALRMAFEKKDWVAAADLARILRQQFPGDPGYWIQLAYALRRVAGLESARTVLQEASVRFPKLAVIPFNMACYECRLGRNEEARRLLDRALELEPTYRETALEDEDLQPLWDDLAE